jgi:hypothetical protein
MTVESFLEEKLQKFSIIDLSCIKLVYFFMSLMIYVLYPTLSALSWFCYLLLYLLSAMPLYIHLFSQPGTLLEKTHGYLKTNDPAKQVLLFLAVFFFALTLATFIPSLLTLPWWQYFLIAAIFAIKPMTVSWFW